VIDPQARTCLSIPSKSMLKPSAAKAPSTNHSIVCATWAIICAAVNSSGFGA